MKQCPYCGAKYPDEATACSIDTTPLDTPSKPPSVNGTTKLVKNDRLWVLYLAFCAVISVFGMISYISNWQRMDDSLPTGPLTILRCVVFLRPLAILAMCWNSRSGVVAEFALGFVWTYVCIAIGIKIPPWSLIGFIILILIVRPRWQKMIWDVKIPGTNKDDV